MGAFTAEQERRISVEIARERPRLAQFVRRRVSDAADAEDIVQDVIFAAHASVEPIEEMGAWLYRVARNRIVDLFRKKKTEPLEDLEDLLPSAEAGPEAVYARHVLLEELDAALAELPREQREAFIANEIDGVSFRELAARTGVPINTLLSRKRYAVLHLRARLRAIYDEFMEGESK